MVSETRPEGTNSLYFYSDQGSYEPLARIDRAGKHEPGHTFYPHTDIHGAPEELTNENGDIVWEVSYQLWGNTVKEVWQEVDHKPVEQNLKY